MAQQARWAMVAAGLVAAVVLTGAPGAQAAGDCNSCPATHKLGRGLTNTVGGVVELPAALIESGRAYGQLPGFFVGTAKGICRTLVRTGAGLVEVVTFPFPLPREHYDSLIDPEFPPNLFEL